MKGLGLFRVAIEKAYVLEHAAETPSGCDGGPL